MGNQVKDILIGAVTIAIGYALAQVVYNKVINRSASTTTSDATPVK